MSGLIQNLPGGVMDAYDMRLRDAISGSSQDVGPQPDQMPSLSNPRQSPDEGLRAAMGNVSGYMADKVKNDRETKAAAQMEFTTDHGKGTSTVTAPTDYIMGVMDAHNKYKQIEGIYAQHQNQLQGRLEYQRQHPWQNALAQLAAGLAQTSPNPTVRGIGLAATRLNPTRDQLQGEIERSAQGRAQIVSEDARMMHGVAQEQAQERRETRLLEQAKIQQEAEVRRERERQREFDTQEADRKLEAQRRLDADAARDRRFQEDEDRRDARQAAQQAYDSEKQRRHEEYQDKREKQRESLKGQKIDPADKKSLEGISAANALLDDSSAMIQSHPGMLGLAKGNKIVDAFATRFMGQTFRQDFESNRKGLQSAIVQAFGEGTRGYTKAGLEYNMCLIPQKTDTPEMAASKLRQLKTNFQHRLDAIKMYNKGTDFSAFGDSSDSGGGGDSVKKYNPTTGKLE